MSFEEILEQKTWAVVGATANKEKFGYKIFKTLLEAGYEVYPVNPGVEEILGKKCYASLKDLPKIPDVVDVVVPARIGQQIIQECAELGVATVWLQPGADDSQIVELGEGLNLKIVHGACVMVELRNKRRV